MTDTLDLEQRLHDLAATIPPPATPLERDLDRGRRRLRRTRWLATGGTAAAVAAIALAIGIAGSSAEPRGTDPAGPATQTSETTTAPAKPRPKVDRRTGAELLQSYRDVLAEHLDPDGTHLQERPDNLQSGGGLGTKLGWTMPGQEGLGMVEIFVGKGWNGFVGASCGAGATCTERTVDGLTAKVIQWDGATTVVVEGPDTTVAITLDALFGNNSLVPVEGMDIPLDDVVRAAADERLTPATPRQIRDAGTSMGFPDLGDPAAPLGEGASMAPVPSE